MHEDVVLAILSVMDDVSLDVSVMWSFVVVVVLMHCVKCETSNASNLSIMS